MEKRRNLPPFVFKQFSVQHNYSTLAVGTDALLLAAWTDMEDKKNVLEVGTGCGLIALALAQKSDETCKISAIDIDEASVLEAKLNFEISNWSHQLKAELCTFQDWKGSRCDLIICNPPFFRNSLKNPENHKILARHQDSFDLNDFAKFCFENLTENGSVNLIYPALDSDYLIKCFLENGLCLSKKTTVYPKVSKEKSRCLLTFLKGNQLEIEEDSLIIYEEDNTYTSTYKNLTKAYYLNF